MELYKLTDINGYTKNKTKWEVGTTLEITIPGDQLCSNQVIHAYTSPLLAELMNPAHANYNPKLLWLAEGNIVANDGTKVGVKKLTIIKECSELLPTLTIVNRVAFGILSSLEVYKNIDYISWANNWLNNIDRTYTAAHAAYAADAADTADYAADAAHAAHAATYTAHAADAATYTAHAATYAAAKNNSIINFQELAEKVLLIK